MATCDWSVSVAAETEMKTKTEKREKFLIFVFVELIGVWQLWDHVTWIQAENEKMDQSDVKTGRFMDQGYALTDITIDYCGFTLPPPMFAGFSFSFSRRKMFDKLINELPARSSTPMNYFRESDQSHSRTRELCSDSLARTRRQKTGMEGKWKTTDCCINI